jgi:hypothetical protein
MNYSKRKYIIETNDELDPNTKRKIKSRYERLKKMQKEGEHMQYI